MRVTPNLLRWRRSGVGEGAVTKATAAPLLLTKILPCWMAGARSAVVVVEAAAGQEALRRVVPPMRGVATAPSVSGGTAGEYPPGARPSPAAREGGRG
jgi:hypothetical protein